MRMRPASHSGENEENFGNARVSTMTKAKKKKPVAKKAPKKAPKKAQQKKGAVLAAKGSGKKVVDKQPQVKQQAALANGMFLYTDDAWSLRYFNQNDLHFKEREVFG
jgi:hypothetical protein